MAKNVVKKNSLSIKAIISIEEDKIMLEIEGYNDPVPLSSYLADFDGQDVTISVNQTEELA